MLEFFQQLVSLDWRRRGAVIRRIPVLGSRVWYADFEPKPADVEALSAAARERGETLRGRFQPPTVVLLHGLGASATSFYSVVPQLRRTYRVPRRGP